MKFWKKVIPATAILLTAGFTQSCDDKEEDLIWDAAPVVVHIDITDKGGRTLLDWEAEKNIVGEPISLEYEGKTYEVDWEMGKLIYSRAYMAVFEGIAYGQRLYVRDKQTNMPEPIWTLFIGEFPGDQSYTKEFVLNFRGEKHQIKVENKAKGHEHTTKFYYDGKKTDKSLMTIIAE